MRISENDFETLVTRGLELIPPDIRQFMSNLQIVIESQPSPSLRTSLGLAPTETLYGLYEGVPLTERTSDYGAFPDRITIFREPLLADFDTEDDLAHEVARTVIHEVAHHFGIDEERLTELGWD